MRAATAILTLVVVLVLVSVAAAVISINNGELASTYECSGLVTKPGIAMPDEETLFIRIRRHGWWLWTDSDGILHYEIPKTTTRGLFFKLQKAGDNINVFHDGLKLSQGQFSTMSNAIRVKISDEKTFNGSCNLKTS
jgi:hypothetical protein